MSKKQIALDVGYSPSAANSLASHVEATEGFHNAMIKLATDSNNLALAAMEEFKVRGFKNFSDKNLVGALNAIGNAWAKFNATNKFKEEKQSTNKLRTVILQQVENQTVLESGKVVDVTPKVEEKAPQVEDNEDEF